MNRGTSENDLFIFYLNLRGGYQIFDARGLPVSEEIDRIIQDSIKSRPRKEGYWKLNFNIDGIHYAVVVNFSVTMVDDRGRTGIFSAVLLPSNGVNDQWQFDVLDRVSNIRSELFSKNVDNETIKELLSSFVQSIYSYQIRSSEKEIIEAHSPKDKISAPELEGDLLAFDKFSDSIQPIYLGVQKIISISARIASYLMLIFGIVASLLVYFIFLEIFYR